MLARKAAADSFLFLTTTQEDPKSTPAVQTLIRQHVMQGIGKSRRSNKNSGKRPGTLQPWPVIREKTGLPRKKDSKPLQGSIHPSLSRELQSEDQNKIPLSSQHGYPTSTWQNGWPGEAQTSRKQMPPPCQLDTLGSGRSNPFLCYPIEMNSKTRRLISYMFDDSIVGNFGLYRDGWLLVGLADAAAFQQVLSMFVIHMCSLYHHIPIWESLSYHELAVKSVKERLSDPALSVSDGIVGAVIGFVCHTHLTQDFDQWNMHMRALKEIIRLRGGLESFGQNTLLRLLLFFVDVIGSYAQDTPPKFPIPPNLPSIPPSPSQATPFPPLLSTSTLLQTHYPTMPTSLPTLLSSLSTLMGYLTTESTRTNGALWRNSILIHSLIDPLTHCLLCTTSPAAHHTSVPAPQNHETEFGVISETARLSALLSLATFRRRAGVGPVHTTSLLAKLAQKLQDERVDWAQWRTLRLWALVLGGVEQSKKMGGGWFVGEAVRAVRGVGEVERCEVDGWLKKLIGWGDTATEKVEMVGGEVWAGLWD